MRHKIAGNRLGRDSTHRKATVRDIAKALLIHQRICTTKPKAKEARKLAERLITLGKRNDLPAKRKAFSILCNHAAVSDLFGKIAVRYKTRQGGYTRIIPLSERRGDRAHLVYLELVDRDILADKKVTKSKGKEDASVDAVKKGEEREKVKKQLTDLKREQTAPKEPPAATHRDKPASDKIKPKQAPGGGIKRFFTKKPSE